MLIEKKAGPGDIVSFRLTTGEEVIGKLISQTSDRISVARAAVVTAQPVNETEAALVFSPLMVSHNHSESFEFPFSAMLIRPMKTRDDVASNYRARIAAATLAMPTAAEASKILTP